MLLQFSVENFASFKDEVILSMIGKGTAKQKNELAEENVRVRGEFPILKSAAIFGANASGKSNLLAGMGFMKRVVLTSFREALNESTTLQENRAFKFHSETQTESSFFEVTFLKNDTQYRYGFEINQGVIEEEWLFYVPNKVEARLFERSGTNIEINQSGFPEGKDLKSKTRNNVLFLSVCAQFDGTISNQIIEWFQDVRFISGIEDRSYAGYTVQKIKEDPKFRAWVNAFAQFLEIVELTVSEEALENVRMDEISLPDEAQELREVFLALGKLQAKQKTQSVLKSWHRVYDDQRILMKTVPLDFHYESRGTQKLIYLLGPIYDALLSNRVLLIDELDARLHSLLTKELMRVFHAGNHSDGAAQFIYVLQDPYLMDNDSLRRDQIYLMEKNQYGESNLYSLLDYKKVRTDARYGKNYLQGNYGAVPYLPDFVKLTDAIYGEAQ